jgi:cyclophilin family peptidyl-prolyl cis-trans isomerase
MDLIIVEPSSNHRQKVKGQNNLSISSPPPKPKKDARHSCTGPSTTRLYIAPQSAVRLSDTATTSVVVDTNARRRRQQQQHTPLGAAGGNNMFQNQSPQSSPSEKSSIYRGSTSKQKKTHSSNHPISKNCHDSDNSSTDDSILGTLEAPCLWMDDVEGYIHGRDFSQSWSPSERPPKRESRQRKPPKSNCMKMNSSGSVASEKYSNIGDDASVHTLHTIHSLKETQSSSKLTLDVGIGNDEGSPRHRPRGKIGKKLMPQQPYPSTWNNSRGSKLAFGTDRKAPRTRLVIPVAQGVVLLILAFVLYDSRRKNIQHKQQLLSLDEERAHILEQMTWIDNAAKKVHKKYSGSGYNENLLQVDAKPIKHMSHDNNDSNTGNDGKYYKDENKLLKEQMDQMQLRVQQNARTRTSYQFGDEPVQVSLPISEGDVQNERFVIALSDDAPHAVNTFLQQVSNGLWNDIDFQQLQNGFALQAATRLSDTKPILEFVEQSRGCHAAGSVALHQLESDEFHTMVLKIHMKESATINVDDVCIGIVVKGFESLERILPQVPAIQSEPHKIYREQPLLN